MFLLVWLVFQLHLIRLTESCLHKGCILTDGLKVNELNTTIESIVSSATDRDNLLRVAQWNILYDKNDIGLDNWEYRKSEVCDYIKKLQPTVIGLQEVQLNQLQYLKACLSEYSLFGLPREMKTNPQYNPVLVKKSDRIRVIKSGTFWLSKTPNNNGTMLTQSKEPRICSWVQFEFKHRKQDGFEWKTLFFATTHLAWRNEGLAGKQLEILINNLRRNIMEGNGNPVILTGDFNWEDNSSMYQVITLSNIFSNTMANSKHSFPAYTALPPYTGVKDYVFENGFDSLLSATMMDKRSNGRFLSDHRTVVAILLVK